MHNGFKSTSSRLQGSASHCHGIISKVTYATM
jgi:hypothetical protein